MLPSLESSEGVAGAGRRVVGAKVIEIVKGLTNEDYESIARNFLFYSEYVGKPLEDYK